FVDAFVSTATRLFPGALLHWEDLGVSNAGRVLAHYRDRCLTFNDDIQGTGIADQLSAAMCLSGLTRDQARARFWAVDRAGLVTTATPGLSDAQRRYARPAAEVAGWPEDPGLGGIGLE